MIQVKHGDLLEATEDIIAHQVNCHGVAGGLAWHVFQRWPDAENDYRQIIDRAAFVGGQKNLLGLAQLTGQQRDGKIIANLFGQYFPGTDYRPSMLEHALEELAAAARALGKTVALPHGLSCGICGGDWDQVSQIIERTMKGVDVVIYRLEDQ